MKNMELRTLKGFRDFLPAESLKRQWLLKKIRAVFEKWGFDPLETPTLEAAELFEGQIGEDEKLFFKFKDQGDRDVALRYDQTVPVCRVVGQYYSQLAMPFRRYQIQPAFRAEKPQRGRYREFLQCDADIFGIDAPTADAEVIALGLDIYKSVGFPQVKVLINDRAMLKDIPYPAIASIDKIKKIGEEGVIKDMETKGISNDKAKEYINFVKNLQPNETIKTILSYLEESGFDKDWYEFDPTIARSFSYSTGPIWEIVIPEFSGGSVLGGERFDKLVEDISGVKVPGTGFGLGFDRTLEAAEEFNLVPVTPTLTEILVTVFNPEMLKDSLCIVQSLRAQGKNVEIYPDPTVPLGKQLKYADKKGIPFAAIIGEEEKAQGIYKIKNMKTGEETIEKI